MRCCAPTLSASRFHSLSDCVVARAALTASIQSTRLFREHNGDTVANWVGELGRARNELLAGRVVFERTLGQGADEDFQQLRINAACRTLRNIHVATSL